MGMAGPGVSPLASVGGQPPGIACRVDFFNANKKELRQVPLLGMGCKDRLPCMLSSKHANHSVSSAS